jgi:hypothetical protein
MMPRNRFPIRSTRAVVVGLCSLMLLLPGCSDVVEPLEPLTLSAGPELSMEVGEELQLSLSGGVGTTTWESSAPSIVSVVAVTGYLEALSPGSATISARRGDQTASLEVTVTVPPLLDLTPADIEFTAQQGDGPTESVRLEVRNTGGGTLGAISLDQVDYGEDGEGTGGLEWLEGSVDGDGILLRADPEGLTAGVYTAVVQVSAQNARNSPQTAAVTLVITGTPIISLDPAALALVALEGEDAADREVVVSNVGNGTLVGLAASVEYDAGPTGWLGTPQLQQDANGGVLRFSPSTAGLSQGSYGAQVTVTAQNPQVEAVTLPVTLTVTRGPAISVEPMAVVFEVVRGDAPPPPIDVNISNGGGGILSGLATTVSYSPLGGGWLSASLSGTTAPATLQLQASPGARIAGTYTATVEVRSPVAENSPTLISVTLNIVPPPLLSVSPGTLNLEAIVGAGTELNRTINVTNAGGGTLEGITASAPDYTTGSPGWLSITEPPGSMAPTQLRLRIATAGLASGVYQARVTVASTTPGVNPVDVTVNLTVLHTFTTHIRPIMTSFGCGGCHVSAPDFRNSLSNTAIYQQVMTRVVPGNPDASTFYRRIAPGSGVSHSGGKVTGSQALVVREWILRGGRF